MFGSALKRRPPMKRHGCRSTTQNEHKAVLVAFNRFFAALNRSFPALPALSRRRHDPDFGQPSGKIDAHNHFHFGFTIYDLRAGRPARAARKSEIENRKS
jgi:hypothetical protein